MENKEKIESVGLSEKEDRIHKGNGEQEKGKNESCFVTFSLGTLFCFFLSMAQTSRVFSSTPKS